MPCARLQVTATCRDFGPLPRHLGSALRGAFGYALLQAVCRCPHGLAGGPHEDGCVYREIFEPAPAPDSLFSRQRAVAPAFLFVPPLHNGAPWRPGAALQFNWVLIGPALTHHDTVIAALARALADGLGLRAPRVRFHLDAISGCGDSDKGALYYDAARLPARGAVSPASSLRIEDTPPADGTLTLHFDTPLHLRAKKELITQPAFRDIARALLARLESLAGFGVFQARPHAPALLRLAQEVRTAEARLERVDWTRYSQRQEKPVVLNGMVGCMRFAGPVGAFTGLLPLGSAVHLGHGTAWGMGRVTHAFEDPG